MLSSIYYDAGNSQLLPPCQQPNRRPYGKASYIPSKRLKNIIRIIIKFYSIKGILQLEESSTWEQVSSCLSYFSFYFSPFHFLIFFFQDSMSFLTENDLISENFGYLIRVSINLLEVSLQTLSMHFILEVNQLWWSIFFLLLSFYSWLFINQTEI